MGSVFNLTSTDLAAARQALDKHGLTGFLPSPPEWHILCSNWAAVESHISRVDLDTYIPYTPLYTFAPKHLTGLRPITSLHVQDLIIYTALVLILRDSIEAARLPEKIKKSFSYRAKIGEFGTLYRSSGAYEKYRRRTEERLRLKRTNFVATLDISDYFPRLYQHRVRAAVEAAISTTREKEAVRVLDKLVSNFSKGGISYGIPIGPYASRNLGEAVLIDVDAALHNARIDFVRWLDDFTIFARTQDDAQEAIYYITSWLHSHHGLSPNQSKTRIYARSVFLMDVWKSYDEEHRDFRQAVRQVRGSFGYDDDDSDDSDNSDDNEDFLEEDDDDDVDGESQDNLNKDEDEVDEAVAVRLTFRSALTIDAEPKYGLIRFILERVIFQPGVESGRVAIIEEAMKEVWRLRPVFESLAKSLARATDIEDHQVEKFLRTFLRKLQNETLFVAGQTLAWVCWLAGQRKLVGLASDIRKLAETSSDNCVVREALIALGSIGTRNDVIQLKDRRGALPNSCVPPLIYATRALGKDERNHWKKHPPMTDFYEKMIFSAT
jgi:Reverse transcriptase (RNA-dependent DNA polymerase)